MALLKGIKKKTTKILVIKGKLLDGKDGAIHMKCSL